MFPTYAKTDREDGRVENLTFTRYTSLLKEFL
jgi:hypothetical protein